MENWSNGKDSHPNENIPWILTKVQGNHVLDINCGDSVFPIHLARKGHQVTGIDQRTDLIRSAQLRLEQEDYPVRGRVCYKIGQFPGIEIKNTYTTIVIRFEPGFQPTLPDVLKEVQPLLGPSGVVIGLIPFILDAHIKENAILLIDVLHEINKTLDISEINYSGKVLLFSGTGKSDRVSDDHLIDIALIRSIEKIYIEQTQRHLQMIDQYSQIVDRFREETQHTGVLANNQTEILTQLDKISKMLSEQKKTPSKPKVHGVSETDSDGGQFQSFNIEEKLIRVIDILAMDVLRLKNELEAVSQENWQKKPPISRNSSRVRELSSKGIRYLRAHGLRKTLKRILAELRHN